MIARLAAGFRTLGRLVRAAWLPTAYAHFVNSERCSFQLTNDPDGWWTAQVGTAPECRRATMRGAILAAHRAAEALPDWQWTTDFLRTYSANAPRQGRAVARTLHADVGGKVGT